MAIMFVGCTPEDWEEWSNRDNNSTDSNVSVDKNSTVKNNVTYDFDKYFFASNDINKTFDGYKVDENNNSVETYLNNYIMKQYGNKIEDSGAKTYTYSIYQNTFEEIDEVNIRKMYLKKNKINDTVLDNCILYQHNDTYNPFSDYSYNDVLVVRCDRTSHYFYYGYKLNYGKVYENRYHKATGISYRFLWNGD